MTIKTFVFNPVSENTYVLHDETKECVIIDAGCFYNDEKEDLINYIEENELTVKHLLNTHLHFDHIFGGAFVEEQYNLQLEAHKDDEYLIQQLATQLQMFGFNPDQAKPPHIGTYLNEGDVVSFGNQKLKVLHIPGHSPGSIVFYNEKEGCIFVGDVLFQQSIGRTDLPGGNTKQLITGIKQKLLTLPDNTVVYSGHGPTTTIGSEKLYNGYLR